MIDIQTEHRHISLVQRFPKPLLLPHQPDFGRSSISVAIHAFRRFAGSHKPNPRVTSIDSVNDLFGCRRAHLIGVSFAFRLTPPIVRMAHAFGRGIARRGSRWAILHRARTWIAPGDAWSLGVSSAGSMQPGSLTPVPSRRAQHGPHWWISRRFCIGGVLTEGVAYEPRISGRYRGV